MQDNDKHESNESEGSPETYKDEITQNKIHKHLTDANDTISEKDIQNIGTNIGSRDIKADNKETEELPPDETNKDDNNEDNREQLPTTWNVLGD